MNIPGLTDLANELRAGSDELMAALGAIAERLEETNGLLRQVVENTEPEELV